MNSTVSTTQNTQAAGAPLARLGWALADAWTITLRDLRHWRLQPWNMLIGWLFPVMLALMFGLFFGGAIRVPEGSSYFDFLFPGILAMTMLFGLDTTIVSVSTDAQRGVTDRFRSMPIAGPAVVLGRCIADMLNSIVGLAVMIVFGLLMGWRWHNGPAAALAAVGLLLLLRFALLWVGIYIGLSAKGPETITSIQILEWPFSFLSNVFVDPATMPAWLGAIAQWNPLSAVASAARALFGTPGWQSASWADQNAALVAVGWAVLLVTVFLPLSVKKYRELRG